MIILVFVAEMKPIWVYDDPYQFHLWIGIINAVNCHQKFLMYPLWDTIETQFVSRRSLYLILIEFLWFSHNCFKHKYLAITQKNVCFILNDKQFQEFSQWMIFNNMVIKKQKEIMSTGVCVHNKIYVKGESPQLRTKSKPERKKILWIKKKTIKTIQYISSCFIE